MNQRKFVFSFAWIVALLVATPAMGQLTNFPVTSLPPGSAYGTTSIGAAFGSRGVENVSLFVGPSSAEHKSTSTGIRPTNATRVFE